MLIDIEKCIGCGNCVRACKAENDVAQRAGLLPHLGRALSHRGRAISSIRSSIRPTAATTASPRPIPTASARPSSCRRCATTARIRRARRSARSARRSMTPDGVVLIDKDYCLGCRYCVQACPYGCRYLDPRTHTADKCTLCYHRITKGLTAGVRRDLSDRRAAARGSQEPEGSDPRVPAHAQGAGAQAADGDRREGLLQRARRLGPVARRRTGDARRRRLHVSERGRAPVERPDRPLPVHHRARRRRVHPRVARARVQRRRRSSRPTGSRC